MKTTKFTDFNVFLQLHQQMMQYPNWVKAKYAAFEEMKAYLETQESVKITSSRDSKTTKVKAMKEFTVFKVPEKQKGYMMPYRNRMVLMICNFREEFTHYLEVFPLANTQNELCEIVKNQNLKKYAYYEDNLECIE